MDEIRFSPDGKFAISVGLHVKTLCLNTIGNAAEWMLHERLSAIKRQNVLAMRLLDANLAN